MSALYLSKPPLAHHDGPNVFSFIFTVPARPGPGTRVALMYDCTRVRLYGAEKFLPGIIHNIKNLLYT